MKTLCAILSLGLVFVATGWTDVGPEILVPLTNGDAKAMRRIVDCVNLAAQEGNRVAAVIVHQAEIVLGQDLSKNYFPDGPPSPRLYVETEKDWMVALEKKATGGDAFFMEVMGVFYFKGYVGMPIDQQKAVAWWEKAAGLNCGLAKLCLGHCSVNGDVVPRNSQKAAMYYREAGELGVPEGWYALGCAYNHGQGVPHDIKKAMECWSKSAPMGHAQSQYTLGCFYTEGKEVPRNLELGIKWLEAAAAQGHSLAIEYLKTQMENESNNTASNLQSHVTEALHPSDKTSK